MMEFELYKSYLLGVPLLAMSKGSGVKISGLYLVFVVLKITKFLSWSLWAVIECLSTDSFLTYVLWQFQH